MTQWLTTRGQKALITPCNISYFLIDSFISPKNIFFGPSYPFIVFSVYFVKKGRCTVEVETVLWTAAYRYFFDSSSISPLPSSPLHSVLVEVCVWVTRLIPLLPEDRYWKTNKKAGLYIYKVQDICSFLSWLIFDRNAWNLAHNYTFFWGKTSVRFKFSSETIRDFVESKFITPRSWQLWTTVRMICINFFSACHIFMDVLMHSVKSREGTVVCSDG